MWMRIMWTLLPRWLRLRRVRLRVVVAKSSCRVLMRSSSLGLLWSRCSLKRCAIGVNCNIYGIGQRIVVFPHSTSVGLRKPRSIISMDGASVHFPKNVLAFSRNAILFRNILCSADLAKDFLCRIVGTPKFIGEILTLKPLCRVMILNFCPKGWWCWRTVKWGRAFSTMPFGSKLL